MELYEEHAKESGGVLYQMSLSRSEASEMSYTSASLGVLYPYQETIDPVAVLDILTEKPNEKYICSVQARLLVPPHQPLVAHQITYPEKNVDSQLDHRLENVIQGIAWLILDFAGNSLVPQFLHSETPILRLQTQVYNYNILPIELKDKDPGVYLSQAIMMKDCRTIKVILTNYPKLKNEKIPFSPQLLIQKNGVYPDKMTPLELIAHYAQLSFDEMNDCFGADWFHQSSLALSPLEKLKLVICSLEFTPDQLDQSYGENWVDKLDSSLLKQVIFNIKDQNKQTLYFNTLTLTKVKHLFQPNFFEILNCSIMKKLLMQLSLEKREVIINNLDLDTLLNRNNGYWRFNTLLEVTPTLECLEKLLRTKCIRDQDKANIINSAWYNLPNIFRPNLIKILHKLQYIGTKRKKDMDVESILDSPEIKKRLVEGDFEYKEPYYIMNDFFSGHVIDFLERSQARTAVRSLGRGWTSTQIQLLNLDQYPDIFDELFINERLCDDDCHAFFHESYWNKCNHCCQIILAKDLDISAMQKGLWEIWTNFQNAVRVFSQTEPVQLQLWLAPKIITHSVDLFNLSTIEQCTLKNNIETIFSQALSDNNIKTCSEVLEIRGTMQISTETLINAMDKMQKLKWLDREDYRRLITNRPCSSEHDYALQQVALVASKDIEAPLNSGQLAGIASLSPSAQNDNAFFQSKQKKENEGLNVSPDKKNTGFSSSSKCNII